MTQVFFSMDSRTSCSMKGLNSEGEVIVLPGLCYSMALGNEKPISNLHDFLQVCVILFGKIRQIIFFCGKCIILQLT